MKITTRLEKIENKLEPEPEIKIIVHKDGDPDIPDDWEPDIIITAIQDD